MTRRVPHAIAVYLGASWALVEFSGFIEERYAFTRLVTDGVLITLALILPSVLVLAWNHGRRGPDSWQRRELAVYGINLLVLALSLGLRASAEEPAAKAEAKKKQPTKDAAAMVERSAPPKKVPVAVPELEAAPPKQSRTCVLIAAPQLPANATQERRWLPFAVAVGLEGALATRESVQALRFFDAESDRARRLELEPGDSIAPTLVADAAARYRCSYSLTGSLTLAGDGLALQLELTQQGGEGSKQSQQFQASNAFELITKATPWAHEAIQASDPGAGSFEEALAATPEAFDELSRGLLAHSQKNWDATAEHLERALELDPNCIEALTHLAELRLTQGQPQEMQRLQDRALSHVHRLPRHKRWELVHSAYQSRMQLDLARGTVEKQVEDYPLDLGARLALARIQIGANEKEAAKKSLEAILEVDDEHESSLHELTNLAVDRGDLDEALELARKRRDLAPKLASSELAVAWVQDQRGEFDLARKSYERAVMLEPGNQEHQLRLVSLDRRLGRFVESRNRIRVLERRSDPELLDKLEEEKRLLLRAMGQPGAALELHRKMVARRLVGARAMEEPNLRYPLIESLIAAGLYDEALALRDELRKAGPDGGFGNALRLQIDQAWALHSGDAVQMREASSWGVALAKAIGQQGMVANARSLEISAELSTKNWEAALSLFRELYGERPALARTHARLETEALIGLGRCSQALECIDAQIEREPGRAELYLLRSTCLQQTGRVSDARLALEAALRLWSEADADFEPKQQAQAKLDAMGPSRE